MKSSRDKERYEKFVSEIKDLNGIRMPRCLFEIGKKVTKVQIHRVASLAFFRPF